MTCACRFLATLIAWINWLSAGMQNIHAAQCMSAKQDIINEIRSGVTTKCIEIHDKIIAYRLNIDHKSICFRMQKASLLGPDRIWSYFRSNNPTITHLLQLFNKLFMAAKYYRASPARHLIGNTWSISPITVGRPRAKHLFEAVNIPDEIIPVKQQPTSDMFARVSSGFTQRSLRQKRAR